MKCYNWSWQASAYRLTTFITSTGVFTTFDYDPQGRIARRISVQGYSDYIYEDGTDWLVRETWHPISRTIMRTFDLVRYWYLNGRPSRVEIASVTPDWQSLSCNPNCYTTYYLQYDWHGDAVTYINATDGTGASDWGAYDPWGNPTTPVKDPKALWDYYRWNGGWGYLHFSGLGTSGMYYVHGRWYRPDLGLFLSPDEKGTYLYNPNQDPVNQALSAGSACFSGESQYLPIVPSLPKTSSIKPASRNDLKALQYKALIKKECATYGIPWQIGAGVLESEIQLDTGLKDFLEYIGMTIFPGLAEGQDVGPGIANIHISTLRGTMQYFNERYSNCSDVQLAAKPGDSDTQLAQLLLSNDFSIRALVAHVRKLGDYRFGGNGQPLIASHANLSGWTIADAVAIWHGYRYGVPRVTPGGQGFRSLKEFRDRTLNLEDCILLNIVGEKNPQESARASIQYFLAYWFMPE